MLSVGGSQLHSLSSRPRWLQLNLLPPWLQFHPLQHSRKSLQFWASSSRDSRRLKCRPSKQRQRDQALADAIRNGQENQRREREEARRAVAELTEKLEQAKINPVKPEIKPEVQQAVVAVQDTVRIVIRDDAAPVAQEQRRRHRIIRRDFADTAEEEETTHKKRKGRDSDDNATTIGDRLFNGYKTVRTFFMGKESTDKWVRDGMRKILEDNQL
jgi:hypothetical protein